jgi:hypothetical protein
MAAAAASSAASPVLTNNSPPSPRKGRLDIYHHWTREERGLFRDAFLAIGRDFKSISERVKSKSKEQSRQYYYRALGAAFPA